MAALVTLLALVVLVLGVLVAGLLRSHAEVLRALHDMGVNLDPDNATQVPRPRADRNDGRGFDIAGQSPSGDAVSVAVSGADRLTLLAFLSSTCLTCRGFWTAFADPHLRVPGDARLVAVTKGPEAESASTLRKFAPADLLTVQSSDAWTAYGVPGAPYFVLVDGATGDVVGEGAATTWEQVSKLLETALADAGLQDGGQHGHKQGRVARETHVDAELRSAGIEPGHPSLYPEQTADG